MEKVEIDRQERMLNLGWAFCPISDTEWEWLKFDNTDAVIARQGDATWKKDLESS